MSLIKRNFRDGPAFCNRCCVRATMRRRVISLPLAPRSCTKERCTRDRSSSVFFFILHFSGGHCWDALLFRPIVPEIGWISWIMWAFFMENLLIRKYRFGFWSFDKKLFRGIMSISLVLSFTIFKQFLFYFILLVQLKNFNFLIINFLSETF